jgi:hypothetical protein
MDNWNSAINNYMGQQKMRVQNDLGIREAGEEAKASLLSAKTAEDIGMTGTEFGDMLAEHAGKFQADMLTDASAAGLVPTVLKGVQKLANMRATQLSTGRWKVVQARRFAQSQGLNPDDAAPENEGSFSGEVSNALGNARQNISQTLGGVRQTVVNRVEDVAGRAGQVAEDVAGRARQALARNPIPLPEEQPPRAPDVEFEDPEITDAGTMGAEVPLGDATQFGQIARNFRLAGATAGSSGEQMGDAIRQSLGMRARAQTMPNQPRQTNIQERSLEGDPEADVLGQPMAPVTNPGAAVFNEADNVERNLAPEAPAFDEDAEESARQLALSLGNEAEGAVTDLAPELTSSMWGTLGSALGDFIPVVGLGLGAWALGTGIEDEIKNVKDSVTDPYAAVRGEIASTQGKINNLQATISGDDFASKIGAGMPSFGSLAARPNLDTSQMGGVALHV